MEEIYLDNSLRIEDIKQTLEKIFPGLVIFHYDFTREQPIGYDCGNGRHIIFNCAFDTESLEFGFKISIFGIPENNSQERSLHVARLFSEKNMVRVLAPFTSPDSPDDPYFDIIFMNGKSYLADDSDTNFGDGTTGLVKILEEYPLPDFRFDDKGLLVNRDGHHQNN